MGSDTSVHFNLLFVTVSSHLSEECEREDQGNTEMESTVAAAPHGTSTRGAKDLESRSPAPLVEVPCGAASRGPWGQNKNPKIWDLGRF